MKKLKLLQMSRAFTALVLALLLMLGTMTTSFAAVADELAETGASVTYDGTEKLFFNMGAVNWWPATGNFVYFYGTSGNAWSGNAVQQTGNYYYVTIPAGTWDHVILTRNSVSSGPSFDNKYNQTGDIAIESGKNYISSFSENSATATWSTYTPASSAQLKISGQNSASIIAGGSVTVTPSLTSNTDYNVIKTNSYTVSPNSGFTRDGNTFTFTAAGSYTITDTVTYNAKGFASITGTATTNSVRVNVVDTPAAGWSVKEGMSFYLDDRNSLGTPKFSFATAADGTDATTPADGETISGLSNIYYYNAPDDGYTYIKVTNQSGTIDSGWCPITSAATNTLTYDTDNQFHGLQLPYNSGASNFTGGFGNIYFDNTETGWTIDATHKLYFVIGRDNYQDMIEMSKVANTDQLYYLASNNAWNNYTFFGFAVATSEHDGGYGPNDATNGVLKIADSYTTLASMYNLAGVNKSFIGIGLNSGSPSALDILWIKDSAIDGSGTVSSPTTGNTANHEGRYLNRGYNVDSGANGTVSVNYYKATGNNTVTAQSGTVSANSNTTYYPVRTSTFKFHPTPNEGYNVGTVTGTGVSGPDGNGDYTVTVVGGDDHDSSVQNISVTFNETADPVLNSLTANNTTVEIGDTVTLTATNTRPTGDITYTATKGGSDASAYLSATSQTAAATNTVTFRATTPGTYIITGTMGGSSKSVTITVNDKPEVFFLGLWNNDMTDADIKNAWSYNSTNNPDRVMDYAFALDVDGDGVSDYTDVYYIDLVVKGGLDYYKSWTKTIDGQTITNGLKIYDEAWYGNNGGVMPAETDWTFSTSENNNAELALAGFSYNATFRFVYNPTTHVVKYFKPKEITYDLNYTSHPTNPTRVVSYGDKAPSGVSAAREGYVFGGWYTVSDRASQTDANKFNFDTPITADTTIYAKWDTYDATVLVNKRENGEETAGSSSGTINVETSATLAAPGGTGAFKGWEVTGSMASHVRLYTDALCTVPYASGNATTPVYVKTDGSDGICSGTDGTHEMTAKVTAVYLTSNTVKVVAGENSAAGNVSAVSGSSYTAGNTVTFDYGSTVIVSFDKLSAGFGIKNVTFTDGKSTAFTNYGHYITFPMPDHDVEITDIVLEPYTCHITIKDSDKVDVDGLSSSGYYSTGASVHTITITGANDYHGNSVLTALSVKCVGGSTVIVDEDVDEADLTFDGHTLHIVFDDDTATITGNIGGNVIITPTCSTNYNINITSKIMSDVGSNYITYYKKTTTEEGKEKTHVADLAAYINYTSSEVSGIDTAEEAAGKCLAWSNGALVTKSFTIDGTPTTFYKIAEDIDGDYINDFPSGKIIYLVTENLNSKYRFLGWFYGSSTGPDLTKEAISESASYAYTLDQSSYIYAVATRDIYLGGDSGLGTSWNNAQLMTYDVVNKVYYYESSALTRNTNYSFKIYDIAATGDNNSSGTNNQAVWWHAAKTISYNSDYGVNLSGHTAIKSDNNAATLNFPSGTTNCSSNKVRIYYKPNSMEVYVIPIYDNTAKEVYLSNGRIDGMVGDTKGINIGSVTNTTAFTNVTRTGNGTTLSGSGTTESYDYYKFTAADTVISFKTTISDTNRANVKVQGFVVYDMDTAEAKTVTPEVNDTGSALEYSGTVTISDNTFICPVYTLSDSYMSSNSIKSYLVYVNAADVDAAVWGGLTAMYYFASESSGQFNGLWPGQLLLPEGTTYTGCIYEKEDVTLTGVLFDNYNVGNSFFGKFGKRFNYPDWSQTYDYLEPITLIGDGSGADTTMLSFSLKQNNDGYHGSFYNSASTNYGPYRLDTTTGNSETVIGQPYAFVDENLGKTLSIDEVYTFDYLTDKDGVNRLNFYGENVGSASAGYYIICVGDADYKNGTTLYNRANYLPNTGVNGQYSVEWYIYDSNGVFLTHVLSDALFGHNGGAANNYVVEKLLATGLTSATALKGKSVKICYEAPNTRGDATRFSGQWYSNRTDERVTVFSGVGMMDNNGKVIVPENPQSNASYGTSAIAFSNTAVTNGATKGNINGLAWGSVQLKDASDGATTLTATWPTTSTFKGWYSYNESADSYTKVSDGTLGDHTSAFTPKFGTDSRYFAMFSAQATYNFVYQGRNGLVTYSVKAETDASEPEMTGGGTLNKSNRLSEVSTAAAAASPALKVFNHSIGFTVSTENMDNSDPYMITVEGTSSEAGYALSVFYYDSAGTLVPSPGSISGGYNTRVDLTESSIGGAGVELTKYHPADKDVFVGWYKYAPEGADDAAKYVELLSTRVNYGFGLTDNLTIAPRFVATEAERDSLRGTDWHSYIDKNVVTQELNDSENGKIYNDTIIRFRYSENSAQPFTGECGIVILAQTKGVTSAQSTNFTGIADNKIDNYRSALMSRTPSGGRYSARMNSTNYGESYAFCIPVDKLSSLNRVDIYQHLDYAKFNGGNYKVCAYCKVGDTYVYSDVVNGTFTPHTYSRLAA